MYPKSLLFRLDPEKAHELVIGSLNFCQTARLVPLIPLLYPVPDRPVEVAGLKFRNPVGLAAGFDKNSETIPALAALGFGFIEVGTLTRRPQPGNPKPRIFRYPDREAIVNRLGFNNRGVEDAARRLERTPKAGVPLGINIGKSAATSLEDAPKEYAESAAIIHPFADYIALNVSSPNTQDLRRLHEPERLKALLESVLTVLEQKGRKPLFLKVSPDASDQDLGNVAALCLEYKVGLIATNTTVNRRPPHPAPLPSERENRPMEPGGLSGRPLRERSTEVIRGLWRRTEGKVPLIGVGGIFSAADAREKLDVGADLVQIYTGLIYKGPSLIGEIVEGLT